MRRGLLICIGSLALVLTAGAQMPYNYRADPRRKATYSGYRGPSAARHVVPQRTLSPARYRHPAFSNTRVRQPMPGSTRVQPRMDSSFVNRPAMTNSAAWRQTRLWANNRWADSWVRERLRMHYSFLNCFVVRNAVTRTTS